ncbi:MAG: hypothetical protein J5677_03200 [Bacteroidales bacterium]|nr:hypothetical protein [Bacteroidales bacterium]
MTEKKKKVYKTPLLSVVEFKMELGYAESGPRRTLGLSSGHGDSNLEGRNDGGNWGNSDSWF